MAQDAISVLDVGHGNCAVLHCDNRTVVVDAGPGSTLLEFLLEEGITRIDSLLVSHADKDHVEGLIAVVSSGLVSVGKIRLNSDALKGSALWDDLAWLLDAEERNKRIDFLPALTSRQSGEFDAGRLSVEILGPSSYLATKGPGGADRQGRAITSNSISATVRVVFDGEPLVLLSADLDEVGLDELIFLKVDMQAQTLVFPHHGGLPGGGNSRAFARKLCEQVRPENVLFSIGRGVHGTPRPEIVQEIRDQVQGVRIACTQLSEHCAAKLPQVKPTHLHAAFSRGRDKGLCCAGTLVLTFGSKGKIVPSERSHGRFVLANAPSALCRR